MKVRVNKQCMGDRNCNELCSEVFEYDEDELWSIPASSSCSVTMKRKSELVSTTGAAKPSPLIRRTEAWNSELSPIRRENCLG